MDRNMQVEFGLKVFLKNSDVKIYGNVKQISLTQTVSEIWFFFSLHMPLSYSAVDYELKMLHVENKSSL